MQRTWTVHWQFKYWNDDSNAEYEPVHYSGSNQFRERGVKRGDLVYVVSLTGGRLYLGGRMLVDQIVSREQAVRLTGEVGLIGKREWVVGAKSNGTPINFHRRLAPELAIRLRFVSPTGLPKALCFVNRTNLDVQATRGTRRMTVESAHLMDQLIEVSDRLPRRDRLITLTEAHIADMAASVAQQSVAPGAPV